MVTPSVRRPRRGKKSRQTPCDPGYDVQDSIAHAKRAGKGAPMRARATSVALFAGVAMIAGCGSSSNTATSAATKAPSATVTSKTSAGAPSFASAHNCQQLAGVGARFARAMSAANGGGKLNFQTAVSAYHALADAAPAEIRPDVQLMAQVFSSFAAALSRVGYTPGKTPTAAQLAGVQSAVQVFSQPKFRAAEHRLSVWAHQNCG